MTWRLDDKYTKSLLHFWGTDGATSFTDETGKTWTANGGAQIDTAYYKFSGSSGSFDGSADWIDTSDSADFDVGSNDFAVEAQIKRRTTGTNQYVLGQSNSIATASTLSISWDFAVGNALRAQVWVGSGSYPITSSTTITNTSIWTHIAHVRRGTTCYLYFNGVGVGSVSVSTASVNNSANKFSLGRLGEYSSNTYDGWIDEFRFSKGVSRYPTNFTPPIKPFQPLLPIRSV